jgi:2-dehydropantoate 2-reductase
VSGGRVCIYGAGAIGGTIGLHLARNGCDVSAVARGATASALRAHGLRLQKGNALLSAPVRVEEDPAALGPQDLVVLAVKAPAMPEVAPRVAPLLAGQTIVLVAMNGVPWWFFRGFGGAHAGMQLDSVDPGGRIAVAIPDRHVIGCVVHLAASVPEPGLVRHGIGSKLIIGEPSGEETARIQDLAKMLQAAGFETTVSRRIQADIWYKLWGNMTMNPISALTGATADRILDDPLVRRFIVAIMDEAAAIGARIGCPIGESSQDRIAVTRRLGAFKTSMLQDLEARRPLEIDALLGVVHEIGARAGVPTPGTDALLGLARLQARTLGLYA